MKVAFRTDASFEAGSGHVMRCLTLATALRSKGADVVFICRDLPGSLVDLLQSKGFFVQLLPPIQMRRIDRSMAGRSIYAAWLGVPQELDALQTCQYFPSQLFDWMIVDHYGIDFEWEEIVSSKFRNLMVIDDLADRYHCCDLLLDQTLGRQTDAYSRLVPKTCQVLTGVKYALLRPEFTASRSESLRRRRKSGIKHLLISMGGIDKDNITGKILNSLRKIELFNLDHITIVMGANAPWLESVQDIAAKPSSINTSVHVNVSDMDQLMSKADLAIGAAGSTAWERCCMGLPTIVAILAENQREVADALVEKKCAIALPENCFGKDYLQAALLRFNDIIFFQQVQENCQHLVDGGGTERVSELILQKDCN